MLKLSLQEWIWVLYAVSLSVAVAASMALFFKRRSVAGIILLIGALVFSGANLTATAFRWFAPILGIKMDPGVNPPRYLVLSGSAWDIAMVGGLLFHAALLFILLRSGDTAKRLAKLESRLAEAVGGYAAVNTKPSMPSGHE